MSRHLPLLQHQFPGQILLSVDDIAKCLKWSKGHIYNLSYRKELPFPLIDGKGGVQVSIIAMADYLDGTLEPKAGPVGYSTPVPELAKARRRGRPRGSVSKRQMAFQSALSFAIIGQELESTFDDLSTSVESFALPDGAESCSDKFDHSKIEIERMVMKARGALMASVLNLRLPASSSTTKPNKLKI
ncbi:MAG: hypothetical protein ACOYBR_10250 [Fluviibacter sp.]